MKYTLFEVTITRLKILNQFLFAFQNLIKVSVKRVKKLKKPTSISDNFLVILELMIHEVGLSFFVR